MQESAAIKPSGVPIVPRLRAFSGEKEGQGVRRISHHTVAEMLNVYPGALVRMYEKLLATCPKTKELTGKRGAPRHHFWLTELQAITLCACYSRLPEDVKFGAAEMIQQAFDVEVRARRRAERESELAKDLRTTTIAYNGAKELVVEYEARLEFQNRHLARHTEYTRATEAVIKEQKKVIQNLRVELQAARGAVGRHSTEGADLAAAQVELGVRALKIADLEATVAGLRTKLDRENVVIPARKLNVAPTGRYARPGWFSYQVDTNPTGLRGRGDGVRLMHGLELLADVGVCDRRGCPTAMGESYCRADGGQYKWDMALVELMRTEKAA